jgi:hypothetical protein
MVGYQEYLVMWWNEADRKHGGTKNGSTMGIEYMDDAFVVSTCPANWTSTKGRKR